MAQPSKPVSRPDDGNDAGMRIDAKLVRELAELLTENALTEIEVVDGDRTIRVARNQVREVMTSSPGFAPTPAAAPALGAAPASAASEAEEISGNAVKSPMVGTAFLSPEPGAKPFISAGDSVKAGDTLLIVEAMKVMNPITAPMGGVVQKIMVADAQPVEFDQPLVIIG